jgi:hypothetical protein
MSSPETDGRQCREPSQIARSFKSLSMCMKNSVDESLAIVLHELILDLCPLATPMVILHKRI